MFGFIIYMLIIGLVAGLLARLLVPGADPMSLGLTWLIGAVGSFVGGFLGYVLFDVDFDNGWFQPAGFFGSIIGAVIVLLIYRATANRRSVTR